MCREMLRCWQGISAMGVSRPTDRQRGAPGRKAAIRNGETETVPVVSASDFEARWAHMDQLAKRLAAVWPKGVSAVEAIAEVRR